MIYRGDDTRAFGGKPLKITLKNAENLIIIQDLNLLREKISALETQ